jgi:hypothetical protein
MESFVGGDSRSSLWFPRSAWEPASADAPRRTRRRRASETVRSHAERGNERERLSGSNPQSPIPNPSSAPRRGAILVVIIVCFALAATLFVLLAGSAVAERRAAETRYWSLQAQWLAEAALERAAARLATDAKYDGETWTVPAEQLGGNRPGVVKIGIDRSDVDHPGRRLVRVEAHYPDDPKHRCRWEKQVAMEIGKQP